VSQPVSVRCQPSPSGFSCEVIVGRDPAATRHTVAVSRDDLASLATGQLDAERLVAASFAYLLEREPRGSILRTFDLSVIERYFPGYRDEIRRRMTA
jgi:hypothetical protein